MSELFLFICLLAKHFVCDFPLQRRYQFENKGIYGHPGGILHASIHIVGTFVVLIFFTTPVTALLLAGLDGLIHYHVDWAKSNINKRYNLTTATSGFWSTLGFDQFLHQMTYALLIVLLR